MRKLRNIIGANIALPVALSTVAVVLGLLFPVFAIAPCNLGELGSWVAGVAAAIGLVWIVYTFCQGQAMLKQTRLSLIQTQRALREAKLDRRETGAVLHGLVARFEESNRIARATLPLEIEGEIFGTPNRIGFQGDDSRKVFSFMIKVEVTSGRTLGISPDSSHEAVAYRAGNRVASVEVHNVTNVKQGSPGDSAIMTVMLVLLEKEHSDLLSREDAGVLDCLDIYFHLKCINRREVKQVWAVQVQASGVSISPLQRDQSI